MLFHGKIVNGCLVLSEPLLEVSIGIELLTNLTIAGIRNIMNHRNILILGGGTILHKRHNLSPQSIVATLIVEF